MKRLALILATLPVAAIAQTPPIPHIPLAHVCWSDGECIETGDVVLPSLADCQAAAPQLYAMWLQRLIENDLMGGVTAVGVFCVAAGVDG